MNISFFISLFLNSCLWFFIFWQIKPQADSLYLHYNIYFGIDLTGAYWRLYILPGSGLIIFLLNTFFSVIIYNREKIISYFLAAINIIAQIILAVAGILIVLLNI